MNGPWPSAMTSRQREQRTVPIVEKNPVLAPVLAEREAALFEVFGANAQRAARGPVAKSQLPPCANTGTSWIAGPVRL